MGLQEVLVELEARLDKWGTRIDELKKVVNYLQKYGYLDNIQNIKIGDILAAVKKFQELAGIVVDGEIGPKTVGATHWHRCALPDVLPMRVEFAKWGITNLTYYVAARDNDLAAEQWDAAIDQAFKQWSDVANLRFSRVSTQTGANFIMSVGSGSSQQFDGAGGTLAWAQLPPNNTYRGQLLCRFDTGETWRINQNQSGILLVNVACHEIGHLLGLEHSQINTALMAPFYKATVSKPVQNDDIARIVKLYGTATDVPPTDPTPSPTLAAPTDLTVEYNNVGGNRTILRWTDNSNGEEGFQVWRNDKLLGIVGRGVVVAGDGNIQVGESYSYKVRAYIGNNYSAFSNMVTIRTGTVPTPEPEPTVTTIQLTGKVDKIVIPGYTVTKD